MHGKNLLKCPACGIKNHNSLLPVTGYCKYTLFALFTQEGLFRKYIFRSVHKRNCALIRRHLFRINRTKYDEMKEDGGKTGF